MAKSCGLQTALKIGGAEAKSDLFVAFDQLTDFVIAPMVETPYAALKCIQMFRSVESIAQYNSPKLLINIETSTAVSNIDSILQVCSQDIQGIVFGRVDFTLSSNLSRSDILSLLFVAALHVSSKCKSYDLEFVLGGGVSIDSVDFLKSLVDVRLDRFETRKCILSPDSLFTSNISSLLQDCVLAELLWLKSKSAAYKFASIEDLTRIEMLEKRHLYNISSCA